MERIKILFIQRVPWAGGAERVIYDIAKNIDKRRFAVEVLCLYSGGNLPKSMRSSDVAYIRLKSSFPDRCSAYKSLIYRKIKAAFPILHRICLRTRLRYLAQAKAEGHFLLSLYAMFFPKLAASGTKSAGTQPSETNGSTVPLDRIYFDAEAVRAAYDSKKVPSKRPIDDQRQARQLADFVGKIHGPLVVVAVMEEAASVVRLALGMRPLSGRPYLLSTHAWESYYLPVMYGQPGYDLEREKRLFAEACQGAEAVLSPCEGCRDDLVEHFNSPPDRTLTLPNPVDIAAIQQAMLQAPEKPLPEDWGNLPFFVVVARFDPQKRHDRILQACALLRRETEDFRVLFIGDGHCRNQVEAEISRLGLSRHVHIIGQCANPFPYMHKALGLICASDSESFGLVLVEALACGCAPISVDCPHAPRGVLDDGKAGFLVEESSEALAEAMFAALNEPEVVREKILHGQTYIRRFDRPEVVRQWELLLAHVAGSRYSLQ